jgi:hypothetical protein
MNNTIAIDIVSTTTLLSLRKHLVRDARSLDRIRKVDDNSFRRRISLDITSAIIAIDREVRNRVS